MVFGLETDRVEPRCDVKNRRLQVRTAEGAGLQVYSFLGTWRRFDTAVLL